MKVFKVCLGLFLLPFLIILFTAFKVAVKVKKTLNTKKVNGVRYAVYYANSSAFIGADIKALAAFGGAFVTHVDKEGLKSIIRDRSQTFKNRIVAALAEPGYTVCVVSDVIPSLTKEELDAVVAHEIGHIVNDHLVGLTGVMDDNQKEMEADAYAAEQVSAAAMKSALVKFRAKNSEIFENNEKATTDINERIERLCR
jgi:Zn-dependent protease with chaperone function